MASRCSRRRRSALTSFPRNSGPTDVRRYQSYETSGLVKRIVWLLTLAFWAATATAADEAAKPSPNIGNFTQSLTWGKIDDNVPPVLGNGDIGGTFDPFGGTTYDELRFGSGARRDIRTLFLTQVMVPDYWVLEDQGAHFLVPRFYRPNLPRRYL